MYQHLKDLRESLGMTQAEFGESIGIAKSTYNNYEKGISNKEIKARELIASGLTTLKIITEEQFAELIT